jgi:amidohydrolase
MVPDDLRAGARAVLLAAIETRRHLHRHPEIGRQEFETTRYLASVLANAGLEPKLRSPGTGLSVEVGSGEPRVAFRADIDALPIQEETGLPFESEHPGFMHACGHDAHSAVAVGIALALRSLDLPGSVRFVLQHAEEQFPGGAQDLVEEGILAGVERIIAFHVDPTLPVGKVGLRAGPVTASSDQFAFIVDGPGGHTARPHLTVDTVYAAGLIVTRLPALLGRLTDARTPLVLVFGSVQGGAAPNVIPARVELRGTARTLGTELWDRLPKLVDQIVREIVAPTGATVAVHYEKGIAPVVNDEQTVADARLAIGHVLGTHATAATPPSMGAEDFSAYLQEAPGAMFRLGVAGEDGSTADLHSARFDIDERAIETGILAGAATLLTMLGATWDD